MDAFAIALQFTHGSSDFYSRDRFIDVSTTSMWMII